MLDFIRGSFFVLILLCWIIPTIVCINIGREKNRNGFLWGLLGWFGVLIIAILQPNNQTQNSNYANIKKNRLLETEEKIRDILLYKDKDINWEDLKNKVLIDKNNLNDAYELLTSRGIIEMNNYLRLLLENNEYINQERDSTINDILDNIDEEIDKEEVKTKILINRNRINAINEILKTKGKIEMNQYLKFALRRENKVNVSV